MCFVVHYVSNCVCVMCINKKTQTIVYASWLTTSHNTLNEKSAPYIDFSMCAVSSSLTFRGGDSETIELYMIKIYMRTYTYKYKIKLCTFKLVVAVFYVGKC